MEVLEPECICSVYLIVERTDKDWSQAEDEFFRIRCLVGVDPDKDISGPRRLVFRVRPNSQAEKFIDTSFPKRKFSMRKLGCISLA